MNEKINTSPLTDTEKNLLLRLLLRLEASTASQAIKRVAKSLFNLLSRERYTE